MSKHPTTKGPPYLIKLVHCDERDRRIAALEAIIGKQEEELHQGELRVAELEAKLKWAMGLNACIEHERAEQAEAELAALKTAFPECIHRSSAWHLISIRARREFDAAMKSWAARAEEGGGE